MPVRDEAARMRDGLLKRCVFLLFPSSTPLSPLALQSCPSVWLPRSGEPARLLTSPSADFGVFYLNQALPFGGAKASGNGGRFAGAEGLRSLCNIKVVTEDRWHGWIQTTIPPLLAYPITSGRGAWTFVDGLVKLVYGRDLRERASGVWSLLSAK